MTISRLSCEERVDRAYEKINSSSSFFDLYWVRKKESPPKGNESRVSSSQWRTTDPVEQLGYHLYFDKRLSADNTVSCNSCHDITNQKPGVDGLPTSVGINGQKGTRNAPTVWNARFLSVQFWDGRAKNLVEQAKGPITNPIEMGMDSHALAIEKIRNVQGYQKLFKKAFPQAADPISIDHLAKAIAAFENTLIATNSPYDRYKSGDKTALSDLQKRGMQNFNAIGCPTCHQGDHFAGPPLPVGTGFFMKFPTYPDKDIEKRYSISKDLGRYEVTKKPSDKNMWRVPSLRNVELTGPYFHNGKVESLKEAVRVMAKTQLNRELTNDESASLVAFLKSLTSPLPVVKEPSQLQ